MWKPTPVEGSIAAEKCYASIDVQIPGKVYGYINTSLELRCSSMSWLDERGIHQSLLVNDVEVCEMKDAWYGTVLQVDTVVFRVSDEGKAASWLKQFQVFNF